MTTDGAPYYDASLHRALLRAIPQRSLPKYRGDKTRRVKIAASASQFAGMRAPEIRRWLDAASAGIEAVNGTPRGDVIGLVINDATIALDILSDRGEA